ncbi:MAG: hypothetical protein J3K34DRAFT_400160 [Monoraphidium minutum]|nr:MAG: hypothetical protein J3K34DRAFT_400160 [Monoraphidium minutum]
MNSARFKRAVTISGGIVGAASAASRERTSCSWLAGSSSDQQDTKPAANSSRAIIGWTCARLWQARSAGDGDCASSSTLKWRIHSAQSSLVTRALLSQALRSMPIWPDSLTWPWAPGSIGGAGACSAACSASMSISGAQPPAPSQSSASLMHGGSAPTRRPARRSKRSWERRWRAAALAMVGMKMVKSCPSATASAHMVSSASRRSSSWGPSRTLMRGCSSADPNAASRIRGSSRLRLCSTARRTSSGVELTAGDTRRMSAGSSRWRCSSSATPSASSAPSAGRTMSKTPPRSASTNSPTKRGSSSGTWGRRSSRSESASSASSARQKWVMRTLVPQNSCSSASSSGKKRRMCWRTVRTSCVSCSSANSRSGSSAPRATASSTGSTFGR